MEERSDVVMKHIAALVPKDVDVKHSGDVTINIVDYKDDWISSNINDLVWRASKQVID